MYIVERIIGIFTYVFIMFIMVFNIYRSKPGKLKKNLVIYLILLVVLAFIYVPAPTADLHRYIVSAKEYASLTFSEILQLLSNTRVPAQVLYFYLLGKTGLDGMVAAVSAFIFYSCSFSILYKASKKFNLSNKSVAISLLFLMQTGSFINAISIIRTSVSFAIIAYCCYTELIENKSLVKHIPLYLFASLMHPAALALILFRLFIMLLKKEKNSYKKLLNYIVVFLLIAFIIANGDFYVEYIFEKAQYYMSGSVYSYIWEYLICIIFLLFSAFVTFVTRKMFKNNLEIKNYTNFLILIQCALIAVSFEYSTFTRLQLFLSILFLPLFAIFLNRLEKEKIKSRTFTFVFIVVSTVIFVISCTRGNLCGYKFLIF